ncbi:MAG: ABC transporter substrate-binding protein [Deltaproteobacteria bacterium]|nr:ABC transporter substrate-binding protein [Deltaproteobacteria bacterium]MBW2542077.1 ABC transporter substrate-binding protein [Deltaproteobacteria bacterium]
MYRRFFGVVRKIGIPAGLLILAMLACGESEEPQKLRPAAPETTLRIISLSPELSRLIVSFGLATEIIGVDAASHSLPKLESTANLGTLEGLDTSAVTALKPDFVFVLGEDDQIPIAAELRERGIPLYIFNPTSSNAVIQSIQDLGTILDRKERAQSATRRLTQEISKIATERDGEKRPSVAWILQRDPIVVVGDRGLLHEILELAGGEIALHQFPGERIEVSRHMLAARKPDLILDSSPQGQQEPIAMGVRTEVIPTSIGELPTLDLLGRIQLIHGLLDPPQ